MKKTTPPIPFAGSHLDQTRHVCAFFNNADEEYRALLPFIKDGFQCGHKAIHVVNPDQRQDHLQRLAAAGINAAAAQQSGQLELHINSDVYLPDGRFDADRMVSAFEQLASRLISSIVSVGSMGCTAGFRLVLSPYAASRNQFSSGMHLSQTLMTESAPKKSFESPSRNSRE
jgi:hypothetical protein